MTRNHQQEALTRVYIQAVAARCGMSVSYRDYDYGIDVTLHEILQSGDQYWETGWKLDIQAKSIVNPRMTQHSVCYNLRLRHTKHFAGSQLGTGTHSVCIRPAARRTCVSGSS